MSMTPVKIVNQPSGPMSTMTLLRFGQSVLYGAVLYSASAFAQQPAPPTTPPPTQQEQHSTELPPGAGRDTVVRVCSKCHSPKILVANPRSSQRWEDTITKMAGLGAKATDDEFTDILDYLSKNLSPQANAKINVNKATATEIQAGLDIPTKDAEAIISFRTKNGDFKSLDDLKKVPEIDVKKFDDKKDKLTF
jgi:competence protein ComEA